MGDMGFYVPCRTTVVDMLMQYSGMSPTEMVKAGEDLDELGGCFIINGNERVLRFVIQQKTNYPIALKRESFRNREVFATDLAILLRSQR